MAVTNIFRKNVEIIIPTTISNGRASALGKSIGKTKNANIEKTTESIS